MRNPGGTGGGGLLADVQRMEQEIRQAQQAVDDATGTAEAADDLVQATVTGRGDVTKLDLDPRVYREFAPDALADEIVAAVNEARSRAQQKALDVWTSALPAPEYDDLAFGPLLAELRRSRTGGRR